MEIHGFQKLTLLDFPGRTACTVFLAGCNFRCPFCHNSLLVTEKPDACMTDADLAAYLKKRRGLLDGVAITGGEPTLYPELDGLCRMIKELGYQVKLDTNGTNPGKLRALVSDGLVDYVAMDIKNSPEKYDVTAGINKADLEKICESIDFLRSGAVDHEFRTTVAVGLHTADDIRSLGKAFGGDARYYLQNFKESEYTIEKGFAPFSYDGMEELLKAAREYFPNAKIRGEDD